MADKLYYSKGSQVWKSPIPMEIEGATRFTVGFPVCTVSEYVGEEGASAVAELLVLGEAVQSPVSREERDNGGWCSGNKCTCWQNQTHLGYPKTGATRADLVAAWLEGTDDLPDTAPVTLCIAGRNRYYDDLKILRLLSSPLPQMMGDDQPRYTTKRLRDEIANAKAAGRMEILDELEIKAVGQMEYFDLKQHDLPCLDDYLDEEGMLHLPDDIVPLLQQNSTNGRLSEAEWWKGTIREMKKANPTPNLEDVVALPLCEWHEGDGFVTWWKFPVDEPSYIGSPLCDDWPGYHTHWTPHPTIPVQDAEARAALTAAEGSDNG